MPKNKKSSIENLYTYNIGFDSDNKNNYGGKTITGSDIKNLIENPADGDLRFKITKSKTTLDEKANLVPDETKGQTQFEVGKDFFGVKWKKKFSRGGGVAIQGIKFNGVK
jgi:hypothetical protein